MILNLKQKNIELEEELRKRNHQIQYLQKEIQAAKNYITTNTKEKSKPPKGPSRSFSSTECPNSDPCLSGVTEIPTYTSIGPPPRPVSFPKHYELRNALEPDNYDSQNSIPLTRKIAPSLNEESEKSRYVDQVFKYHDGIVRVLSSSTSPSSPRNVQFADDDSNFRAGHRKLTENLEKIKQMNNLIEDDQNNSLETLMEIVEKLNLCNYKTETNSVAQQAPENNSLPKCPVHWTKPVVPMIEEYNFNKPEMNTAENEEIVVDDYQALEIQLHSILGEVRRLKQTITELTASQEETNKKLQYKTSKIEDMAKQLRELQVKEFSRTLKKHLIAICKNKFENQRKKRSTHTLTDKENDSYSDTFEEDALSVVVEFSDKKEARSEETETVRKSVRSEEYPPTPPVSKADLMQIESNLEDNEKQVAEEKSEKYESEDDDDVHSESTSSDVKQ